MAVGVGLMTLADLEHASPCSTDWRLMIRDDDRASRLLLSIGVSLLASWCRLFPPPHGLARFQALREE